MDVVLPAERTKQIQLQEKDIFGILRLTLQIFHWNEMYQIVECQVCFTIRAHLHPATATQLRHRSRIGYKAIPQWQQN